MAIQDIRLKIHHIDGDMTAPWEYVDTVMKCEVGTPMVMSDIGGGPYKLIATMSQGAVDSHPIKALWISMGEHADGLSLEELMSGALDSDSAALSYLKPIPLVYVRNDMVLESTSYEEFAQGDHVVMNVTGENLDRLAWTVKELDSSDKLPTFLVIDAQPMVEGQELMHKLLLRYIG